MSFACFSEKKFCDRVPADVHYISKTVFIDIGIIFPIMSAIDSSSASVPVNVLVSESPQVKRQYAVMYLEADTKMKLKLLTALISAHGMPVRSEEWVVYDVAFPPNVAFLGRSFTETLSQHDCFKDLHARMLKVGDSKVSPIEARLPVLVEMLAIAEEKSVIASAMTAESTTTVEKKENKASQVSKELSKAKAKIAQLEAMLSANNASKADSSLLVEVAELFSEVSEKDEKTKKTKKDKKRKAVVSETVSEDDIPLRLSKVAKIQAAVDDAAPQTETKKAKKSSFKRKGK